MKEEIKNIKSSSIETLVEGMSILFSILAIENIELITGPKKDYAKALSDVANEFSKIIDESIPRAIILSQEKMLSMISKK